MCILLFIIFGGVFMATYNSRKPSVTLDNNRKRYALVAGNGIAILMSDDHKFRRFDSHSKNAIMNSLEALAYILAKCPTNDSVSEKVIDIGIPNCIKGVFGASFRQYIRTQKFVGSGEIIPVFMLDKMKEVVRMYNDRNFNVNIYSLSLASVDEEMTKIKQRAIDVLYKVQVEDTQAPAKPQQQPVGYTQEQVNQMIQNAVAQAMASFMQGQTTPVATPAPAPAPQPTATPNADFSADDFEESDLFTQEDFKDFDNYMHSGSGFEDSNVDILEDEIPFM